tara:strand:- start:573 stop:770 length:198 start_codon:yes stop_codon:yes gene_type:complete
MLNKINSIKKGSIVKIKNEFCSKEEIGMLFIVVDDRDSRMLIAPVSSKLLIPGTESVPTHMLLNN